MVTPLMFGCLQQLVSELGLDAAGLAHLLEDQKGYLTGRVHAKIAGALALDPLCMEPPLAAAPQATARETHATAAHGAGDISQP